MLSFNPHRNSATKAPAAEHSFHQSHVRLAAEIAIGVSALALWGLLAHLPPAPAPPPSGEQTLTEQASSEQSCVHFGRAGGHCPGAGALVEITPKCEFLGRAGRFCPPSTP